MRLKISILPLVFSFAAQNLFAQDAAPGTVNKSFSFGFSDYSYILISGLKTRWSSVMDGATGQAKDGWSA